MSISSNILLEVGAPGVIAIIPSSCTYSEEQVNAVFRNASLKSALCEIRPISYLGIMCHFDIILVSIDDRSPCRDPESVGMRSFGCGDDLVMFRAPSPPRR